MSDASARQRREIHYSGRVQGVGFRYTVRNLAAGLAVVGFVKNLPDGRVQLVVEGETEEIQRLVEGIRAEMGHYLSSENAQNTPPQGGFERFEVRF